MIEADVKSNLPQSDGSRYIIFAAVITMGEFMNTFFNPMAGMYSLNILLNPDVIHKLILYIHRIKVEVCNIWYRYLCRCFQCKSKSIR